MKKIFALQEAAYTNEWFGILPNDVTLLIFRKRERDIQPKSYKSYSEGAVKKIYIPRFMSSVNFFTTNKVIDHITYTISAFACLPKILKKDAVVFVTPPFWATSIIPILKLFGKEVYIVASDPQTRLYETARKSWNPAVRLYSKIASGMEKMALKLSDKVFVVSEYLVRSYSKYNQNIFYVPNGADVEAIEKIPKKRMFKEFTITYAGSFDAWRSVDMLVEAFRLLQKRRKNIRLLLIGGGGNIDKIRGMCKDDKNVMITGWLRDHDDVIAYCKGSDVVVFPARKSEMATTINSMKCYEYVACEAPLVVTDTGEHAGLVRKYDVGLVAPPNAQGLAASLEKLARDRQLYNMKKSNCKKHKGNVDFKSTRSIFVEELNR